MVIRIRPAGSLHIHCALIEPHGRRELWAGHNTALGQRALAGDREYVASRLLSEPFKHF